MLVYFKHHQP